MLFNVNRLFGKDTGTVQAALGPPVRSSDTGGIHFAHYVKGGAKVEVQFEKGKAVFFFVNLPVAVDSPERALALVGVDVRRRRPAEKSAVTVKWRGKFGHPGIRQVAVIKDDKGWKDLCVQNEEE